MGQIAYWMGKPVEELSREELLAVINHLATENQRLWGEGEKMRDHLNWGSYLSAPPPQ